jgi:hypothetical protein
VRIALFWHGRRPRRLAFLSLIFLLAGTALADLTLPAAAAGPSVSVLSSNGWSDYVGTTRWLHLVAEVQNTDARDVSQARVTFNLFKTGNIAIGPESTSSNYGLTILSHSGNKSPYGLDVPAPAGYDHFTVASVTAAPAATGPDQNFTIVTTVCPDAADANHICGMITNNNAIAVDDVHVVFTFFSDVLMTQIADQGMLFINSNGSSSLDANASASFELVRPPAAPDWKGMTQIGESSTTTPAAPSGAFATGANQSATVSWFAPPDGGRTITGYTVTSSPPDGSITVSGNTRSTVVGGLHNGVSYTFSVTASNAFGTGFPSSPSNAVIPATVPDPPVITGVTPGNSSAMITWSAPFDGGRPITGYLVNASPADGSARVAANQLSVTLQGLKNGTAYTFTVTASNVLGSSPPSAPSSPVVPAAPPGAPTGVVAVASDAQATVSWTAPASDGSAPITSYTVTSNPDGITAQTGGSRRTASVTPLRNGIAYTFTVAATNRIGSTVSAPSAPVTPSSGPPPPPPPPPAPVFSSWERAGGVLAFAPVASTWGSERLDVFVAGTDGILYHRFIDGGAWQPWEGLPGPPGHAVTSEASAVSAEVGTVDIFVRGGDAALWHRRYANGLWEGWQRLGGVLAGAPAAVTLGAGRIDVFVEGTDSRLYLDAFDGDTWSWSGPGGLIADSPVAVSASAGSADAFVMGVDGALWRWSTSTGWAFVGGRIATRPAATVRSGGILDAFVNGVDGSLWHWSSNSGWEGLGGRITVSPSAVSADGIRLDVFVRGTDGALWHDGFNGTTWSWEGLGGQLSSAPSAASWAAGRFDVVVRASDRSLWHIAGQ